MAAPAAAPPSVCIQRPLGAERQGCWATEVLVSQRWDRAAQLLVVEFENPLQRPVLDEHCRQSVLQASPLERETVDDWIDRCLEGTLRAIDPLATLFHPGNPVKTTSAAQAASFGLEFRTRAPGNLLQVVAAIKGGPADRAGMRTGDVLLQVNGTNLQPLTMDQVIERMRGEPGSTAELQIQRAGQQHSLTLRREAVRLPRAEARRLPGGALYARIRTFDDRATQDLVDAVAHVLPAQATPAAPPLVVDLRGNAGGLLTEVLDTASVMLPAGTPVLAQTTRQGREVQLSQARPNRLRADAGTLAYLRSARLLVLVDKGTAVGAEALALALRNHRGARVAGEATAAINNLRIAHRLGDSRVMLFTNGRLTAADGPGWVPGGVPLDRPVNAPAADPGAQPVFEMGSLPQDQVLAAALSLLDGQ